MYLLDSYDSSPSNRTFLSDSAPVYTPRPNAPDWVASEEQGLAINRVGEWAGAARLNVLLVLERPNRI
jgi:hypothetical protein